MSDISNFCTHGAMLGAIKMVRTLKTIILPRAETVSNVKKMYLCVR